VTPAALNFVDDSNNLLWNNNVTDYKTFLKDVAKHPERFYIVHYSSQSLYDEGVEGFSPRITSIAIMHVSTRQTVSFSIHAVAEEISISKELVQERYDDIERALLERFYTFVRDRREKYWIHWNMRNVVFGFEHLEHRYRVLTHSEPPSIPVEVRINLNDVLSDRYGSDYAKHPRMLNLMLLNGQRDVRFLEGSEEAEAFKRREFIRMHSSTIAKVEFFRHIIVLAEKGRLRVASSGVFIAVDRLLESRWARVSALAASVMGLAVAAAQAVAILRTLASH
jgi:hypothetical protein